MNNPCTFTALLGLLLISATPAPAASPFELDTKELGGGDGKPAAPKPKARKPAASRPASTSAVKRPPHRQPVRSAATGTSVKLVPLTNLSPCETVSTMLKALAVNFERGRSIEVAGSPAVAGQKSSLLADYYIEVDSKRIVINCSGMDPYSYSLYRVLQLRGYRVMNVPATAQQVQLAANLLGMLEIRFQEGKFRVQQRGASQAAVEVEGILATGAGSISRVLLVTGELPGKKRVWQEGDVRLLSQKR